MKAVVRLTIALATIAWISVAAQEPPLETWEQYQGTAAEEYLKKAKVLSKKLLGTGVTDPRIQMGNNVRSFPSTLPDVRTHDLHLLDVGLYKTFSLPKDIDLQIRVEAINALNYTVLWNANLNPRDANFGKVNQDRNNPRDIQLGARLSF